MDSPLATGVPGLVAPVEVPVQVDYCNASDETFVRDAIVICSGTLVVEEDGLKRPALSVRQIHWLGRWGVRASDSTLYYLLLLYCTYLRH